MPWIDQNQRDLFRALRPWMALLAVGVGTALALAHLLGWHEDWQKGLVASAVFLFGFIVMIVVHVLRFRSKASA